MVLPIDHFDADEILRDPEDYFNPDEGPLDEDEVKELDLGNPNRLHELDIISEEDEYL